MLIISIYIVCECVCLYAYACAHVRELPVRRSRVCSAVAAWLLSRAATWGRRPIERGAISAARRAPAPRPRRRSKQRPQVAAATGPAARLALARGREGARTRARSRQRARWVEPRAAASSSLSIAPSSLLTAAELPQQPEELRRLARHVAPLLCDDAKRAPKNTREGGSVCSNDGERW